MKIIYENTTFIRDLLKYSIRSWIYDFLGTICLLPKERFDIF